MIDKSDIAEYVNCLSHECAGQDKIYAYKVLHKEDEIFKYMFSHCRICPANKANNPPPKPIPLSFWLKLLIPIGSTIGACSICILNYNNWFALPLVIIAIFSMIYIDKSMST